MRQGPGVSWRLAGAAACWLAAVGPWALAQTRPLDTSAPAPVSGQAQQVSLDEYKTHLQALTVVVQACEKARDAKACDPMLVGQDDQIPASQAPAAQVPAGQSSQAEQRLVRYGWLRVLLSKAQDKDAAPPKPKPDAQKDGEQDDQFQNRALESARPAPPTTSQLLKDAEARLESDIAAAGSGAQWPPDHPQQRAVMKQVLSGREYRGLQTEEPQDSALEKVGNWLNNLLDSLARASSKAPWLGRLVEYGFITLVCVGLVWGLLQLERRWRVKLIPEDRGPAPGAASAIPWQIWLEDARRAAAAGLWREAIHFLYWASISRLESKRLWPADRARTPREYLALVGAEDPRRAGLTTLTRSFERVWYGGRAAAESDYSQAERIAQALIHGHATGGGTAE